MAAPARQPVKVVPDLQVTNVTRVQLRVTGTPEILVERTNGGWHMLKPVAATVRPFAVDGLLRYLAELKPDNYLSAHELVNYPNATADFGFESPQISLMLYRGTERRQVLIGSRTAPGDQVFVQLAGRPGIHIVSTNLLGLIPHSASAWRDTQLLDWQSLQFDRLQVSHAGRTMELVFNPTNRQWRLARLQARADSTLVEEALAELVRLQIAKFIDEDSNEETLATGLDPADLELTFSIGTNRQAILEFGSPLANSTNLVYGSRGDSTELFAVPTEGLSPWRVPAAEYRDRHLFSLQAVPDSIEVRALDQFTLTRQTNNLWRVEPGNFIADTNYMSELIDAMVQMQITKFVKDVVTGPDLPDYGLGAPAREYTVNTGGVDVGGVRVLFGTNQVGVVYVKRSDEASVATVRPVDFDFLPAASWEMRDRRIWLFDESAVTNVHIEQGDLMRDLVRKGTNSWALAEGSFGQINTFGVDETIHRLGDLTAARWVEWGDVDRARYGFTNAAHKVSVQLTNGAIREVEFGGTAPSQYPYALVTIEGQPCVFEFPWATAQYIETYLSIPVREH